METKPSLTGDQSAFEEAGIELLDENGGGEGVRLRNPRRSSDGKGVDRRPKRG